MVNHKTRPLFDRNEGLEGARITARTIKVIMDELRKLKMPLPSEAASETNETALVISMDKTDFLEGAGKTLDFLSNETKDTPQAETFGHMDTKTIL